MRRDREPHESEAFPFCCGPCSTPPVAVAWQPDESLDCEVAVVGDRVWHHLVSDVHDAPKAMNNRDAFNRRTRRGWTIPTRSLLGCVFWLRFRFIHGVGLGVLVVGMPSLLRSPAHEVSGHSERLHKTKLPSVIGFWQRRFLHLCI